ncbi:nitroreductase family protein [Dyadobacter bucti]|uniref:nitroreductase family protein n=1 Tax=Dyadobacter bucti TaxID=2572203 RepID=UPI003F6ED4AA
MGNNNFLGVFKKRFKESSAVTFMLVVVKFRDEVIASFHGLKKYQLNESSGNVSTLRRNIHRIEKGLITMPAKNYFAESFILETVEQYKKLIQNPVDIDSNDWATSILKQYFDTVQRTPIISKAEQIFISVNPTLQVMKYSTYPADTRQSSSITYDDFLNLNIRRRSVRYYLNTPVPREDVQKAVKIALQAPSACNRQPFTFRIIDDPALMKQAALMPAGTKTFADAIPMMIFIIGDLSNYFDIRDKHLIYIDGSLAAMNFVLALETMGLSSCMINWADLPQKNRSLQKFLNLTNWERCVMAISVGYADPQGGIPSSVKKNVQDVIKYNL